MKTKEKRFKIKDNCGKIFFVYAINEIEARIKARKKTTAKVIYIIN